jgi:hypothetical protein
MKRILYLLFAWLSIVQAQAQQQTDTQLKNNVNSTYRGNNANQVNHPQQKSSLNQIIDSKANIDSAITIWKANRYYAPGSLVYYIQKQYLKINTAAAGISPVADTVAWVRNLETAGARADNGDEVDFQTIRDELNEQIRMNGANDSLHHLIDASHKEDYKRVSYHHRKDSITGIWKEHIEIDTTGLGGAGGGHVLKSGGTTLTTRPTLRLLSNTATDLRDSSLTSESILDLRKYLTPTQANSLYFRPGIANYAPSGTWFSSKIAITPNLEDYKLLGITDTSINIESGRALYLPPSTFNTTRLTIGRYVAELKALQGDGIDATRISGFEVYPSGVKYNFEEVSGFHNKGLYVDEDKLPYLKPYISNGSYVYKKWVVDYIDSLGVGGGASLPSQSGNGGKFLTTSGSALSWANMSFSSLSGVPSWIGTDSVVHFNRVYSDPAFVGSLAWSKIASKPSTISGYNITDALSTSLTSGQINVGNGSGIAAPVTPSGDVTIDNTGVFTVVATSFRSKPITQTAHGFAVGDVLKKAGGVWAKAKADANANAEALGIVASATTNTFILVYGGEITGLSGLTTETNYFLSSSTAGATTSTEPTVSGTVSKPIFFSTSSSTAIVQIQRGVIN